MHWKLPGSTTQWRYHQDARTRKPDSAFRKVGESYIQCGIAVERHTKDSGGMRVVPGSHLEGRDLGIEEAAAALGLEGHGGGNATEEMFGELLRRVGIDPSRLVDLDLQVI
jgi:hypothetical protein